MTALLKKARNGGFWFSLKGTNGEKIASSEVYTRKAKAIQTLNKYFPNFKIEDKTTKS